MKLKISSLKKLVTDSMAIDMGTASTIIAVKGRGVVLDEPSLVAVNEITEEIVAFGQEAADMSGREGRDITVRAPLIGGVVADFERTKKMLAYFVKKAKTGGSNLSLQAVMSMVSDVTHVEQRALLHAAEEAGIGKVFMMEEGLAAAFGAGVLPNDKRASAIIDIGAGTTNIAIVAKGFGGALDIGAFRKQRDQLGSCDSSPTSSRFAGRRRDHGAFEDDFRIGVSAG
jgi:rod shape-determining protein MreB